MRIRRGYKRRLRCTDVELFALSKYACCCCLEEHNWIAALSMIGYAPEALAREPSVRGP